MENIFKIISQDGSFHCSFPPAYRTLHTVHCIPYTAYRTLHTVASGGRRTWSRRTARLEFPGNLRTSQAGILELRTILKITVNNSHATHRTQSTSSSSTCRRNSKGEQKILKATFATCATCCMHQTLARAGAPPHRTRAWLHTLTIVLTLRFHDCR